MVKLRDISEGRYAKGFYGKQTPMEMVTGKKSRKRLGRKTKIQQRIIKFPKSW